MDEAIAVRVLDRFDKKAMLGLLDRLNKAPQLQGGGKGPWVGGLGTCPELAEGMSPPDKHRG
ncbi:MAG: hypothetical protein V3U26_08250, partial [Dehalococcoidia bacterium]